MKRLMIFAPIAKRESIFYLNIAKQIVRQTRDINIKFISFFQPYNNVIKDSGFEVFDIYKYLSNKNFNVKEYENKFDIDNMNKKLIHEKLTFAIYDTQKLQNKFCNYLDILDKYLIKLKNQYKNICVYQELGGFIAPLSLYYASRKNDIEHIFFEPAFFKGRLHFVKNSLDPINIAIDKNNTKTLPEVEQYLKKSLSNKEVVIPDKDKHHFKDMGFFKIINNENLKKIYYKIYYKYIKKQKQEYEHIYNHIKRYIKMYINRKRTNKLYTKYLNSKEEYIYFPFHVQLDYSLTIRSLEYLNQLALVEYIAQILPNNIKLYIKEHPASIGGFDYYDIKKLLKKYDNIKLIYPTINSYDIINNALGIITINSKTGAEALVAGKEVIVLGNAFYKNFPNVHKVESIRELQKCIFDIINHKLKNNNNFNYLFNDIWKKSYPIELYKNNNDNINRFVNIILKG